MRDLRPIDQIWSIGFFLHRHIMSPLSGSIFDCKNPNLLKGF
jgi:hypothetical protein